MISVTTDLYPFVIQDTGSASRTEADFVRMFDRLREVNLKANREGTQHVVLLTGRDQLTAAERKIVSPLANAVLRAEKPAVIRSYVIVPDALSRAAFTALQWLVPGFQYADTVAMPELAVALASDCLTQHGVPFSPASARQAVRRLRGAAVGSSALSVVPPSLAVPMSSV